MWVQRQELNLLLMVYETSDLTVCPHCNVFKRVLSLHYGDSRKVKILGVENRKRVRVELIYELLKPSKLFSVNHPGLAGKCHTRLHQLFLRDLA